ncbi:hypothetical protein M23134_04532 [Microscilla marina ATCC 23134]|uniref:Uncharacterized protein n=1 Tax=Microscilla marina ATCC 23134 TaxID=313606 RepID=A1ZWB3_MICM2|nr:hypothetical protein M23134_04532 [Microscilla marina ATCC 23134]
MPDDPFLGTIIFLPDRYLHEYVHPVGQISPPWVIFFKTFLEAEGVPTQKKHPELSECFC